MNAPHLFREHLPYTIKMLYGTITEAGKSKNEVTNNALMDAFCTNARALLEFSRRNTSGKLIRTITILPLVINRPQKKFAKG